MSLWLCIFSRPNDSIAMVRVHTPNRAVSWLRVPCRSYHTYRLSLFGLGSFGVQINGNQNNSQTQRNEYLWKYQKIPRINVFVQSPKNLVKLYGFSNKFPPCTNRMFAAPESMFIAPARKGWVSAMLCSHWNPPLLLLRLCVVSNESNVNFNLALVLFINYLPIGY